MSAHDDSHDCDEDAIGSLPTTPLNEALDHASEHQRALHVACNSFFAQEEAARLEVVALHNALHLKLLLSYLGHWAATDIQKLFRGHMSRKRVRLRRKRLLYTVLMLQRVSRGGFARRNIKLLRIVLEQPQRKRLVMKYRYLQRGDIVVPRVAAAFLLQRFARRVPSIVRVQHVRDLYRYIIRCAVRIQSLAKRAQCRRRYGPTLVEHRRARHERLLLDYVERQLSGRRLWRVECQDVQYRLEREVCSAMLGGMPYQQAVQQVATNNPTQAMHSRREPPWHRRRAPPSRESTYASFCNERHVVNLGDWDTTDSDDDSIDEELLRPQHKPVKLVAGRRKKVPVEASSAPSAVSDVGSSGWLLRAYPGTTPPPVPKLSRAASALRLARTPSAVARCMFGDERRDDEFQIPGPPPDVYSRLAHHWFE